MPPPLITTAKWVSFPPLPSPSAVPHCESYLLLHLHPPHYLTHHAPRTTHHTPHTTTRTHPLDCLCLARRPSPSACPVSSVCTCASLPSRQRPVRFFTLLGPIWISTSPTSRPRLDYVSPSPSPSSPASPRLRLPRGFLFFLHTSPSRLVRFLYCRLRPLVPSTTVINKERVGPLFTLLVVELNSKRRRAQAGTGTGTHFLRCS